MDITFWIGSTCFLVGFILALIIAAGASTYNDEAYENRIAELQKVIENKKNAK